MSRPLTPDGRVARVAARHHGLVTRPRALGCGLSDRQVEHRVRVGRWERLAPGVYRIAGSPVTPAQDAYAATLAAGQDAVVCGLSSLALLQVADAPKVPFICVGPVQSARTRGAVVRRAALTAQDRTHVGPIPTTTPARALLEAAPHVPDDVLERLVDDVLDAALTPPSAVLAAIRRAGAGPGRHGAPRLRSALQPWLEGVRPGSPAEVRLLRRLEGWGLPGPVRQHPVVISSGRTVLLDLAWPAHMVALEYDGSRWHAPRDLPSDVKRDEALRGLGWWVARVDRHDLAPSSTRLRDELGDRLRSTAA